LRGQPDGLLCVCVFEGSCEAVFGLDRGAMWGHDGPMPAETPSPEIPPLTCRDFTSWHLGGGRWVQAHLSQPDGRWEVLQLQFGRCKRRSVHLTRDAAEAEAQAWAVLLATAVTT